MALQSSKGPSMPNWRMQMLSTSMLGFVDKGSSRAGQPTCDRSSHPGKAMGSVIAIIHCTEAHILAPSWNVNIGRMSPWKGCGWLRSCAVSFRAGSDWGSGCSHFAFSRCHFSTSTWVLLGVQMMAEECRQVTESCNNEEESSVPHFSKNNSVVSFAC